MQLLHSPRFAIFETARYTFLKDFFLMWTIFKALIEFVTTLLLFYVSWLQGKWNLSSPTRGQILTVCFGRWKLQGQLWDRHIFCQEFFCFSECIVFCWILLNTVLLDHWLRCVFTSSIYVKMEETLKKMLLVHNK